VLALVPQSLREAGLALGVSKWRTVLRVVLPTSIGGILTGTTLAVARVAGETAPLLFTSALTASAVTWDPSQPLQSIPLSIFELSDSPDPTDHARAWAAGIVLIGFVLVVSLLSKVLLARSRRKISR
jgi:phosphate transport system permease protein